MLDKSHVSCRTQETSDCLGLGRDLFLGNHRDGSGHSVWAWRPASISALNLGQRLPILPPLPSLSQWWPAHKPLRVECWPHPPLQVPQPLCLKWLKNSPSGMSSEQWLIPKDPSPGFNKRRKLGWNVGPPNSWIQAGLPLRSLHYRCLRDSFGQAW